MSATLDFPHRVDALRGDVQWASTSVAQLRAATFLDGRETFWSGSRVEALAERPAPEAQSPGMIFHVGFCGSTLLARLLDRSGSVLVLKEPQALADLASQAPQLGEARLAEVLGWAMPHLAAAAPAGEACVIKPSNWINGLAPALAGGGHVRRAIFLTMAPRAYLRAVFRGGRDRLAHCLRLAELLAHSVAGGGELVRAAIARADDPLDRSALLVVLLHRFQLDLFDRAETRLADGCALRIDHAELAADPLEATRRAAAVLDLPGEPTADFDAARHSKDMAQVSSADAEESANREIEHHHGARFDMALAWFESRITAAASR
ncbi:MAG: hypothetical protein JY451_05865 [Erythrobacter sp.]|nr:MAG: hypothetical protein JY451_05865 [Erythrobacter sp.]